MNISNSNYNLYEPVSLTNEIPHLSVFNILNRQLKTNWAKDIIGQTEVDYFNYDTVKLMGANLYDIFKNPYDEKKEPELYRNYINNLLKHQSVSYQPTTKRFISVNDSVGNIETIIQDKINFSVTGLFETEIDYLMHEAHRYLFKLYPEHINTLKTLTPTESLMYLQEAGYILHNNFDLSNIKGPDPETDLYLRHKFITNLYSILSYTGIDKQESLLINLMGGQTQAKSLSLYTGDNKYGILSNKYDLKQQGSTYQSYQFFDENNFLIPASSQSYANTQNDFSFTTLAALQTISSTYILPTINVWSLEPNLLNFIIRLKDLINNLYRYNDVIPGDKEPLPVGLSLRDLILNFKKLLIENPLPEYHTLKFLESFYDSNSLVPIKDTLQSLTMEDFKTVEGSWITNLYSLEDLLKSEAILLGETQYNKRFLNYISLMIYEHLIQAFSDRNFKLTYNTCLSVEEDEPWITRFEVRQKDSLGVSRKILAGILNNSALENAYIKYKPFTIGSGVDYEPYDITPKNIFTAIIDPHDIESPIFSDKDLTISFTISRLQEVINLEDFLKTDPHSGVSLLEKKGHSEVFGLDWRLQYYKTWDEYELSNELQSYSLGSFIMKFNTVEVPYLDRVDLSSTFTDMFKVDKDYLLSTLTFYNKLVETEKYFTDVIRDRSLSISSNNIAELLSSGNPISDYYLYRVTGTIDDTSSIKLDEDISYLMNTLGKLDCLIVDNLGNNYYATLNKCYIQNTSCIANISRIYPELNLENFKGSKIRVYFLNNLDKEDKQISKVSQMDKTNQSPFSISPIPFGFGYVMEGDPKSLIASEAYDNLLSEDLSRYDHEDLVDSDISFPSNLVKNYDLLTVSNAKASSLQLYDSAIQDYKSLYVENQMIMLLETPYLKSSVIYLKNQDLLSLNTHTELLPNKVLFANITEDNFPKLKNLLSSLLGQATQGLSALPTLVNKNLVVWGDIVWDTQIRYSERSSRSIWSSYLAEYKIFNVGASFPKWEDLLINTPSEDLHISQLCRFNYAYNRGSPQLNYCITLPGPDMGYNTNNIKLIKLNEDFNVLPGTKLADVSKTEDIIIGLTSFKTKIDELIQDNYIIKDFDFNNCQIYTSSNYTQNNTTRLVKSINYDKFDINLNVKDSDDSYKIYLINKYIINDASIDIPTIFETNSPSFELLSQSLLIDYVRDVKGCEDSASDLTISFYDVLDHLVNKIQTTKQVPVVLQVESDYLALCGVYAVKNSDGKIVYDSFKVKIVKLPELLSSLLNLSNNRRLQVPDNLSLNNLKVASILDAFLTPVNTEGSVKHVDLATEAPILTSYDNNGFIQNRNFKSITDPSTITLGTEDFSIKDVFRNKSSTTKYITRLTAPKFKEFSNPLIDISLAELKDGEKYPNIILKFPDDWKLSDDENILIGEMSTPITRSTYSPANEIYLLDRNYSLEECKVISTDSNYIYLKDDSYSNNVANAIGDLYSDNPKPIEISSTKIDIYRHWPALDSNIDYDYFKRKFIAKGLINKNSPDRLVFDDLGEIVLSDHISPIDKIDLVLLNTADSSIEPTTYKLPNIIPDIDNIDNYTWKMVGGFLSRSVELEYTIYLFAKSENDSRLYKLLLNSNPSISLCDLPEDYTWDQIIDVYLDDSLVLHYLTTDLEITGDPIYLNEDYILSDSLAISDEDIIKLNLGGESINSEIIYRGIGKNLKVYEDSVGRLSIKKEDQHILLNDISKDNYTYYTLDDLADNSDVYKLLESIIPVDESGKILNIEDPNVSSLDKIKIRSVLRNPVNSAGKTIQQALSGGMIKKLNFNSFNTSVNTGIDGLGGSRVITAITLNSNSAQLSDLPSIKENLNRFTVNNFGQKSLDNFIDTNVDPNKGNLIFIDKERCIVYNLIKSTNELEITPLDDYLSYNIEDISNNTKTNNCCLVLDLETPEVFDEWKTVMNSCLGFEGELDNIYKQTGVEKDFNLTTFNNWLDEVSSLIYSNPTKAYRLYNEGFSLDKLIEYFKYNSMGRDFENLLNTTMAPSQLEAYLGEGLLNPRDVYISKCLELGLNCDNWGLNDEPLAPLFIEDPGAEASEEEKALYNNFLIEQSDYESKIAVVNELRDYVINYNKQAYYRAAFLKKKPIDSFSSDPSVPDSIINIWEILKDTYNTTSDPLMKLMCFAGFIYDFKDSLFNIDSNSVTAGLELPGSLNNLSYNNKILVPVMGLIGFKSAINTVNVSMDENIIYISGTLNTVGKDDLISLWGEGSNQQFYLKLDTSTRKIEKMVLPASPNKAKGIKSLIFLPNQEDVILESVYDKASLIKKSELDSTVLSISNNDNLLNQLPLKPIFDSNYFTSFNYSGDDLYITSTYNINEEAPIFSSSIKDINSDYITLMDEVNFDSPEQLEVVAFIEDLSKDNFKLGFNSVTTVLETIPEDFTMFRVSSKSYADFAMRCNSLKINTITGKYEPIFENNYYPKVSDIKNGAKVSDFYLTDDYSNLKILANKFGRSILPILPISMSIGEDNQLIAAPGLSNIIKKDLVDFLSDDYKNNTIKDEYSVTLPYNYIIGKDYEKLSPLCDKLYYIVDNPITAISNNPIEVETLSLEDGSILEVYDDYIKVPLSNFEEKHLYESNISATENARNSINENLSTLKENVTIKGLEVFVKHKTNSLPKKVKIGDVRWGLNQDKIYTDASEIVFPNFGYGCSSLDEGSSRYFNPDNCKFSKNTFFKTGSLKNKKDEYLKVFLGEDEFGENIYNEDFFKNNTLMYKSFKEADISLPSSLRIEDSSLAEVSFLPNQLMLLNIVKSNLIKDNILSLSLEDCVGIFGQNYKDFYNVASSNKTWSIKSFRKSEKVDENKSIENLRDIEIKIINAPNKLNLEDIIGYTRRSSTDILKIVPVNTQFNQLDGFSKGQTPFFIRNGLKEYVIGDSPDNLNIYACDLSGKLIRLLDGGELVIGGSEGMLVPAANQAIANLNVFDFILTSKAIVSKSGLYPLIAVSSANLKMENDSIYIGQGGLKYAHTHNSNSIISANLDIYNTSVLGGDFETCTISTDISELEFTYKSSLKRYNYVTFLTKNNKVAGAIYLKDPVDSKTAVAYIPISGI